MKINKKIKNKQIKINEIEKIKKKQKKNIPKSGRNGLLLGSGTDFSQNPFPTNLLRLAQNKILQKEVKIELRCVSYRRVAFRDVAFRFVAFRFVVLHIFPIHSAIFSHYIYLSSIPLAMILSHQRIQALTYVICTVYFVPIVMISFLKKFGEWFSRIIFMLFHLFLKYNVELLLWNRNVHTSHTFFLTHSGIVFILVCQTRSKDVYKSKIHENF